MSSNLPTGIFCDRYLWDCLVDLRINFPNDAVESGLLGRMLVALTPRADIAFFLLISVEESLRRSKQRESKIPETEAVLKLRLEQYQIVADQFQWPVLDAERPIAEVAEKIHQAVFPTEDPAPGAPLQ